VIVLDASAMVHALLQTPVAPAVERWLAFPAQRVHAPHLIDLEVAQVLRRYRLRGELSVERCRLALAAIKDFPLIRYPHQALLPRIWELRNNLTAYDAAYVALAEALDAPLLTRDRRIAAAPGHWARVELV
jgi:predicted nucleic acid-binding protein